MADNGSYNFSGVVSDVQKLDDSTCIEYQLVKNKKIFLEKLKTEQQNIEKETAIKETLKKELIAKETLIDTSISRINNMKKLVKEYHYSLMLELEREQNKTGELNQKYMQNISKYEALWEKYEETYNSLSYVHERNEDRNRVRLLHINLKTHKVQMKEVQSKIQILKEIQVKKEQNLIVKFAELWIKRRNFLRTRAEMLQKIRSLKKHIEEKKVKMIYNTTNLKRPRMQETFVTEVSQFSCSPLDLVEHGLALHIPPWDSPPRKTACLNQRDVTKVFKRETMSVSALVAAGGREGTIQHTVQDKIEKYPPPSQGNEVNSTLANTSLEKHNAKSALREDSVSRDTSTSTLFQHNDVAEEADEYSNSQSSVSTSQIDDDTRSTIHCSNADCNLRQRSNDNGSTGPQTPMQESALNKTALQRNDVRFIPDQAERISIPLQSEMVKESSSNIIQVSMQREESSTKKKGILTSFEAFMKIGGISTPVRRGIPTLLQVSPQNEGNNTPPEQTMSGKDTQGRYVSAQTATERNERMTIQADAGVQIEERTKPDNHQKAGTTSIQVNSQRQNMRSEEVHHCVKSTDNQSVSPSQVNRSDVSSATLQISESTSLQEATNNHKFINFSQTKMFPENNVRENPEGKVADEEMQNSNEAIEQPSTSNDGISDNDQAQLFLSGGSEGSNDWEQHQHLGQNFNYEPSPEGLSDVISPQRDFLMTSPLNSNEEQNCPAVSPPLLSPDNQDANANSAGVLGGLMNQISNNDTGFNFNFGSTPNNFGFSSLFQGSDSGNANKKSGENSKSGTIFSLF